MAKAIIHVLEAIEIQHEHSQEFVLIARLFNQPVHFLRITSAIQQSRQMVAVCHLDHFLFGLFAFGNIANDAGKHHTTGKLHLGK